MNQTTKSKSVLTYRTYRKARDRALIRLSHLYPDTYKQLLAIERKFDEKEGKDWTGIDGFANLSVGIHTRANAANDLTFTSTSTGNTRENEGDNGGEA
jgi:hypothetical protein